MTKKSIENLIKEAQKIYLKQWREKNKEKIKKYNQNYWLKKAQELANSEA